MRPPEHGDTWLALGPDPIPVATAYEWAVRPECGAVVLFSGTVRNHAEGRDGVTHLDYEAYEEQVLPRFEAIATEIRRRWPSVVAVGVLHRVGRLLLGESSVVVLVSSPHRGDAFDAARFGIDTLKTSAPIWKRESWETGDGWALGAHEVVPVPGAESGN